MVGWLVYGGFQPYYLIENDHLGYWSPEKDFRRRQTFWQRVRKLSSESRQKDAEELRFCFVLFCFYLIYFAIFHAINNNKIYPDKYTLIKVAKSFTKTKKNKKNCFVWDKHRDASNLVLKSFLGVLHVQTHETWSWRHNHNAQLNSATEEENSAMNGGIILIAALTSWNFAIAGRFRHGQVCLENVCCSPSISPNVRLKNVKGTAIECWVSTAVENFCYTWKIAQAPFFSVCL